MITNLLASIVIVLTTNTITTDNYKAEGCCYAVLGSSTMIPAVPATERYDTVTIYEERHLKVNVEGERDILLSSKPIHQEVRTFSLSSEWTLKTVTTNTPPSEPVLFNGQPIIFKPTWTTYITNVNVNVPN